MMTEDKNNLNPYRKCHMEGFKRVLTTYYNNKGEMMKTKTKQQLAEEIKALQTQLDAMPEVLGINYKPKMGEEYFFIRSDGEINSDEWNDYDVDQLRYEIGNCYPNYDVAERIVYNRMTLVKLREFAFVPDFENGSQEKYSFYMDGKELRGKTNGKYNYGTSVHSATTELRRAAMEAVGEAAIVDMLQGGLV